jgi:3-hydroxyacyl-CoA dehydrogenase
MRFGMAERAPEAVRYAVRDRVAVIRLDNPPVNGLGSALRARFMEYLQEAQTDPAVDAVVIIGSATGFSAGADIRELGKVPGKPDLSDLHDRLDAMTKPLVAAIGGFALGGGLELALACHYRIAAPAAQLGLPEVELGLLPGAGGTQRLPRLIPPADALRMMTSGSAISSESAKTLGLVDAIVQGDLLEAALRFATALVARGCGPRRVRDLPLAIDFEAAASIEALRAQLAQAGKDYPAPLRIVACVEAAATLPFDEGCRVERECFTHLLATAESKALRHLFFAEREASKIPDVAPDTPQRRIERAAVVGAGTMGGGIAMCFADAGIPVTLIEVNRDSLERGLASIRRTYQRSVERGRLGHNQMEAQLARIEGSIRLEDAQDADIIVEAVFERMDVKTHLFRRIDAVARPGAILASNTSTLDIDEIARATRRPRDVVGMHFFSPAPVMRLLEIVRGAQTGKDVLASVVQLAKKLKKVPVLSGVCDGFIGNRMLERYGQQALFLLDEGATPQQVDGALTRWGMAMGVFAMYDMSGNDIGWEIRKRHATQRPDLVHSGFADRVCEEGRFGQKTGKGFYSYSPGGREPIPDPEIDDLLERHRRRLGISPRKIGDDEIVERCVYALASEGARILEEGIALRASDIDVVYVTGYGFPPYRGGPMFYADSIGAKQVLDAVARFQHGYQGGQWKPAPLLVELAAQGRAFSGYPAVLA